MRPCSALCTRVRPCAALCGLVHPCAPMCGFVRPCVALCGLVRLRAPLCGLARPSLTNMCKTTDCHTDKPTRSAFTFDSTLVGTNSTLDGTRFYQGTMSTTRGECRLPGANAGQSHPGPCQLHPTMAMQNSPGMLQRHSVRSSVVPGPRRPSSPSLASRSPFLASGVFRPSKRG